MDGWMDRTGEWPYLCNLCVNGIVRVAKAFNTRTDESHDSRTQPSLLPLS